MYQTGLQVFVSTQQVPALVFIRVPLQSFSRHMTNVYCFYSADIMCLNLSQMQYSTYFSSLRDHKLQYSVDSKNSGNSLTLPNSEQLMLQPLVSNPRRGRTL